MNKDEMLAIVKPHLTIQRYEHTLGVVDASSKLAARYDVNTQQAETAAIFHDYAKYRDPLEMRAIIEKESTIPSDLLDYNLELWHAPVGAYLVEKEIGITDQQVLDAIRYHTTGRVQMSTVEKVICLADYIEPSRRHPGVDIVRKLAYVSLEEALAQALLNTIDFLKGKNESVYPLTVAAYHHLSKQIDKRR